MDTRQKGLLGIAAVCGIGTTVFAFLALQSAGEPVVQGPLPRQVLAATSQLDANRPLRAEDTAVMTIPGDSTFDQLYALAIKPEERASLEGRELNRPVPAGAPLLASDVVELIDLQMAGPDKRALSLDIKDAAALAGLLVPGDRVDVLVTIPERPDQPPAPTGGQADPSAFLQMLAGQAQALTYRTEIVVEDVKVLAIGPRLTRSRVQFELAYGGLDPFNSGGEAVTLEVTTDEARRLLEKSGAGKHAITLLLRSQAAP